MDERDSVHTVGRHMLLGRLERRGWQENRADFVLYEAHRLVEQMTLDRDLVHLRDRLSPEVAEMVYYGFWYCAKMDALLAFIKPVSVHSPIIRGI